MVTLRQDEADASWVVELDGVEAARVDGSMFGVAINVAFDFAEPRGELAFLVKRDGRLEILASRVWCGCGGQDEPPIPEEH